MSKKVKFKANYNGNPILPGEVMVPFEYVEGDIKANCKNPECIRTLRKAGRTFRVVYKAVPEEFSKMAKSQFNLVQNEILGHYTTPNSVSLEALQDEYELELAVSESAEDLYMKAESLRESLAEFIRLAKELIETNAKIGYAVLLVFTNTKGRDFYNKMRLTQSSADRLRHTAEEILCNGMVNIKPDYFKFYHSKFDGIYREEALALLDKISDSYKI